MNPNIFREFSIRGVADLDLTDDVMVKIGWAIGVFCKKRDLKSLVLGRDVRSSSLRISQAVTIGLQLTGIDIIDIGVVPTPVHNFATDFYHAGAGVMITASHNPPEDNGLKIRTDRTLHSDELQEIYRIAQTYSQPMAEKVSACESTLRQISPISSYLQRLMELANLDKVRLKVVIDGGNGANGPVVSRLLNDLGLEVVELYCELDGGFPGRGPDPTSSVALIGLSDRVQAEGADLGLAYDGDGDRLALVDEVGHRVFGDQIIMILARDILKQGPASIVYEILCTQALADDVLAYGGKPVLTPSGYAFVHQAMHEAKGALGGELSGHLFFNEPDFRFDDAILATIKLLNIVAKSKRPLSELVAALPTYHSSPQIRLSCPDEAKSRVVDFVQQHYAKDYKVDTVDGARIHFDEGWAMVRKSNTQPVISMRFEARTADQLSRIQRDVQSLVEAEIERLKDG